MQKIYLLLLFLEFLNLTASAQVTVDVTIDTLLIRVGEQTKIHLQVSMDAGDNYDFPEYVDTLVNGVECLEASEPAIEKLNDGKRILIIRDYLVTSFDSGHYYLPPMEVLVNKQVYKSKPLSLKVFSMDVDTSKPEEFFGPKDVMDAPFDWKDWSAVFFLSILLIPLIAVCIYLIIRYRDNKPIIRHIKQAPKLPPHQKAMIEIQEIKSEKTWQPEDSKEYYTRLTDTLRNYIKERYGFNATEMTSSEIIEHLTDEKDEQALSELRLLFRTADLVKFAKYSTMINENDMNLVNAIEFIDKTKVEVDPAELNRKDEMTVEEKRSRTTKMLLLSGIILLSICSIGAIFYIGYGLYEMLF